MSPLHTATMPKGRTAADASVEIEDALETRNFFISRVSRLNALLKRRAAVYAKQSFDFTPLEWRVVTLLPTLQPISIRDLASAALTDGPHMSRTTAVLETKGLLTRRRSEIDSRQMLVVLTEAGESLSREMCRASLDRNEQLLEGLSPKEIERLNAELDELIDRAEELLTQDLAAVELSERKPRRG